MNDWNFAEMWNLGLIQEPRTEFKPRDYLWASELYNAPIDLFLKLKGTKPSNLPNDRSMRKFDAGNLTELFVKMILLRVGIYKATQTRVKFQKEDMLEVSGKIDFEAGGKPVESKEISELLDALDAPELLKRQSEAIIKLVSEKYPEGCKDKILEIKSVATFGMNKIEKTGRPLSGHDLQAFHYAHGTGKEVELVYICREDLRAVSFLIQPNDETLLNEYTKRISNITNAIKSNVMPEKEPLILYDELEGRFSTNFKVQYSSYLTMLYGFKHAEEYAETYQKRIQSWNRVLGRIAKGAKMTPKNEEILKDIESMGYDLSFIRENVTTLASQGLISDEEESEE